MQSISVDAKHFKASKGDSTIGSPLLLNDVLISISSSNSLILVRTKPIKDEL